MTMQELVGLGRAPYTGWHGKLSPQDKKHIAQAIESVGMEAFASRKVDSLSDGERQKAMIARALAQNTPIMILDEPTAHLDLSNRLEVFQLMNHLAQHLNKAILLSTHELELALHQSDYLWLMDGNKEELVQGLPEDLVLQGAIDQAFPSLKFQWQQANHWLEIPEKSIHHTAKIWLESADMPALQWTKHALQRLGFEVIEQPQEASFNITIERKDTALAWHTTGKTFHSIQQLLALLLEKKP